MKTHKSRRSLALVVALVGSALPSVASAQTVSGWALDRYEPTTIGDVFFMAEHPWYSSTRTFSVGIIGDYAVNPLVLRQEVVAADGACSTGFGLMRGFLRQCPQWLFRLKAMRIFDY